MHAPQENPCSTGSCAIPNPQAGQAIPGVDPSQYEAGGGVGGGGVVSPAQVDRAAANFQAELERVRAQAAMEGAKKATMPAFVIGAVAGATLIYVLVRWKVIKG